MCNYSNSPIDVFVVVDTSSSMAVGSRIFLAETVAKSLRLASINTPWSTITFFSFDDFGYRWEWSTGTWLRYKFPWNTPYGVVGYWSNPSNRPMTPPFYDYWLFTEAWSQTNIIEWYNALTSIVQQFPNNSNRKKIVYWLSDWEPTIWSQNQLCGTGQQPCQTTAAASRADQFRATYPDIDVVAVWLDTQLQSAIDLLKYSVASDISLFTNVSSSSINWWIEAFCAWITNLNHPLNSFSDLYCEEICAPNNGVCWPLNGTSGYNATQLTPSTPWMCAPWLVEQLVSIPGTWWMIYTWECASTNGGTGSNQCTATKEYCGDAAVNWPEVCDTNWNLWCNGDKICMSCWACVTQWWCGYLDGQSIYDFNNAWDAISWNSLWLCVWGYSPSGEWINYIATGFVYDDRWHQRTWSCIPENSLDVGKLWWMWVEAIKTICQTTEMRCGDWTVQNTGSITYEQFHELLLKELDSIIEVIGWNSNDVLLPWGKTRNATELSAMQSDLWDYKSHQAFILSLQTPAEQCETHLDCAQWQNCLWCQCKTVWACHPDLQYIYAAQETPTYLENGTALCLYGQTANIVYDTNANKWTYQCVWDPGTPTASCEVAHLFCGDRVVNNINSGYPTDFEECEPTIGVWCTLQCTFETYECQWIVPTNATLCLNDDQLLTWDTTNSLVALCSGPKKCEYICNAWYDFNGTHCTQTVACNSKPFNTTWHNGDGSYAQYLSGTTRTPTYSTTHSVTNNINACEFYCNANYTWNGTACAINMYTVLFSWNGGTGHTPTSKLVTWNTILGTLPTDPTYSGYAFNGWWNQTIWWNTVTSTTVITWNRTVYAQWTQLPVTGVCGNANNITYPYSITQYAPDMQCAIWTPTTTAFPALGGTVSWTCSWLNGWPSSSQCSASRANTPINWACWTADGFVYALTWSVYAPLTQCASWSPTNTTFPAPGDSQTRICIWQYGWLPSTTCSASRQSWSCDLTNTYASWSVPGRRCPTGWTLAWWPGCYMCKRDELGIARCLMPECWNGVLDWWEVCDDGNINNNDSCTNDCARPYCGDGIYTPSATWTTTWWTIVSLVEMCDPTMTWSSRCPQNCLLTGTLNSSCNVLFPAHLWYNVTDFNELNQPGSLCFPFWMATPWAHTNEKWKWSCPWINWWLSAVWCELPKRRCGDGVLDKWIIDSVAETFAETCDDGNMVWWDGCSATCTIEPVVSLATTSGLCTLQSYPQIEVAEYLPIRWAGTKSPHTISVQSCNDISWNPTNSSNGIKIDSIKWNIDVYRWWTSWLESVGNLDNVKIAQFNTTSSLLIADAIKDFGYPNYPQWISLIWTKLVEPAQIEWWVNAWGSPKYGQYLLRLPEINYSYCSLTRLGAGTATGQTNVLSYTENCSNNFDDNGNGLIDCADTVFCATAENCIVWTGGWMPNWWSQTWSWWNQWSEWEICNDGEDNDDDWRIDCADSECWDDPVCMVGVNENCLSVDWYDDDWDNKIDSEDPDCVRWYQFEEWYVPVPALSKNQQNYTYTWTNGYVCEAGFSVSKWYFVQQWFAFTEQANAWLDAGDFVSIWWVPLVTEWTVLDDGENNVTTYSQQWAKSYLFSGFIDTRELKATNNIQIWSDNWLVFKKVPNAHIYFWQWESQINALWQEVLELNSYNRKLLLNRWWVPEWKESTTPYTIVLPWSTRQWSPKQVLDIQWTLTWNALYVSQWDIKFSSSDWSCDFSDTVEWLFIAAGEFTTDPINNKDANASRRCKWWNLKINGTLLWSNAWSSLAPLRRSVIDARNPNATFFDNSLVFQAKELFETCYLPALAHRKASTIYPSWWYTSYNWPLVGCNIDKLNNATAAERWSAIDTSIFARDYFLTKFTLPWNILATALTCNPLTLPAAEKLQCERSISFVYEMMDSVQNANSLFVIPKVIKKVNTIWSNSEPVVTIESSVVESFINNPQTLLWKMNANSKRFPARWFAWMTNMPSPQAWQNYVQVIEDVIFTPDEKPKMMNDVSKAFGGIKDHFIGFSNFYKQLSANNRIDIWSSISLNTLIYKLSEVFWIWVDAAAKLSDFTQKWYPQINTQFLITMCWNYCPTTDWNYCSVSTLNKPSTSSICYVDNKWLRENAIQANNQWTVLASNIVDWSSVVISSQPKLWTDLPPGAKDFLNNIVVVPR
jgi:uncharacterized repeat protein (TIGR02543 family)